MRVRRVRVLIYEGPAEWVEATLKSTNRYVIGKRVVSQRKPDHFPYDIIPGNEPLIDDKVITEYLTDTQEIS